MCLTISLFVQDNEVYTVDYEKSVPGLNHLISAPKGRGLFIPESMVDKIEQKGSIRGTEEMIATLLAEEMRCPKHELLDQQQKVIEEANRNKEQKELEEELKRAGVPPAEVNEQAKQYKRLQEEHLQSKVNKDAEDAHCFRQPGGDPNSYQQLQQSKPYDYQGRQKSRDHQKKHEGLHSSEGCHDMHGQPSYSPAMGSSVNKQQENILAGAGYGPAQDITVGSVVQLPNTGGGAGIFGIVRWIGELPNVAGQVAGIELVRINY